MLNGYDFASSGYFRTHHKNDIDPGPKVIKLEYRLNLKIKRNDWLWTHVRKQSIIVIYFELETVLKFYNLQARYLPLNPQILQNNLRDRRSNSQYDQPHTQDLIPVHHMNMHLILTVESSDFTEQPVWQAE